RRLRSSLSICSSRSRTSNVCTALADRPFAPSIQTVTRASPLTPQEVMNMRRAESFLVAVLSLLPSAVLAQGGVIRGRFAEPAGAPLARATIAADAPGL